MKLKHAVIPCVMLGAAIALIYATTAPFVGENNQPPARTNHPGHYGYYELGNLVFDLNAGVFDTEIWMEHMAYSWAARYRIPLQGNITLTEALYRMFQDAGWRASRTLPSSKMVFWLPISSFEWIHTNAVPITDTIMVGEPVFVNMY